MEYALNKFLYRSVPHRNTLFKKNLKPIVKKIFFIIWNEMDLNKILESKKFEENSSILKFKTNESTRKRLQFFSSP